MTTKTNELCALSLTDVSRLIAAKEVSPVTVTEAVLERIERLQPSLNAFVTVTSERALASARASELEILRGEYRGPLHGVPYSLKDLIFTKGIRTTGSARILADWVPEKDATILKKFDRAGAVLVGKNQMLEFAYGEIHPDFGQTFNPWNLGFSTSGSSSGSGAAVSAGLGYASIGSDTGGSIRFPAALCGIVGLKPTTGLVSRSGGIALSWTLDNFGPMTRTARDAALVLDVVAGHDPADPASAFNQPGGYAAQVDAAPQPLVIGVVEPEDGDGVMPDVRRAFDASVEAMRLLGYATRPFRLPDPTLACQVALGILYPEASAIHLPWLRTRPQDYAPNTRLRLELGALMPATVHVRARRAASVVVEHYRRLFDDVDVLMTPSTQFDGLPSSGPPVDPVSEAGDPLASLMRFSAPFNVTGLPAVSVPCGLSQRGLPIGAQFVGRPFADGQILQLAHVFEGAVKERIPRPAGNDMVV